MSSSPDNFESLRKLLSLKRHEQPPPGFFAEFPRRVMARLEREAAAPAMSLWQRFTLSFEWTPALACALGVVVCGLLLTGVVYSFQDESAPLAMHQAGDNFSSLAVTPSLAPFSGGVTLEDSRSDSNDSTTPLRNTSFPNFLFNGMSLQAAPANYSLGNR